MAEKKVYIGTGRRKTSVAKVRMTAGKGKITINGKDVNEYLPFPTLIMDLMQPLEVTGMKDKFDIVVDAYGGGFSGQAGATRLGIARALLEYDSPNDPQREDSFRKILKANGFITRDPRKKERKKYGLKKARRAPQFSKR
ncbi:MAG: 30S ribosomal protein S9 [Bacilli bacterium]|nr:30S ribosomal protein S9 [Bacilli bacterium]MDD4643731.1 30S ribosomal protein S9 [Bacilli bacterium]